GRRRDRRGNRRRDGRRRDGRAGARDLGPHAGGEAVARGLGVGQRGGEERRDEDEGLFHDAFPFVRGVGLWFGGNRDFFSQTEALAILKSLGDLVEFQELDGQAGEMGLDLLGRGPDLEEGRGGHCGRSLRLHRPPRVWRQPPSATSAGCARAVAPVRPAARRRRAFSYSFYSTPANSRPAHGLANGPKWAIAAERYASAALSFSMNTPR